MAQYNSVYVNEAYSPIVVANLRKETFLVDGVTYNSSYASGDPQAGVVHFYKYTAGAVGSAAPAADFSTTEPENALIDVYLKNAFRSSRKLFQVTANSISHNYADQVLSEQTQDIREGRERCAIAALVSGGTASTDTTQSTASTIKENIQADLTAARKKNVKPNIIVLSPDALNYFMTAQINSTVFTPETNEELIKMGSLGKLLGMSVFMNQNLEDSTNTAVVYQDTTSSNVNLTKVEYILYDAKYFAVIDNLNYVAIKDSEMFAGSKSNIEINTGFKVMDAKAVVFHRYA